MTYLLILAASFTWSADAFSDRALQLESVGENGYRLFVKTSKVITAGPRQIVKFTWSWSEIDTRGDEPVWTRPRRLDPARHGLPAQLVWRAGDTWPRVRQQVGSHEIECARFARSELCVAPDGAGLTAVKGRFGGAPELVYAPAGWIAPH